MKRYVIMAAVAAMALPALAKSDKRGVSENQFSLGSMLEALEPGVTWYYNWGSTPGKGYENQVIDFEGIEFVPMCWNGNFNASAIREYCQSHPNTKYILGFNEPNFTSQANMTPQQAAEKWPEVKALADELGLKVVAPALNYSPNPPYTDPLKWMDEFVALVGLDAFDFTAVHSYGGVGVTQTLATNFHNRYGKDVWVTEFCYWPGEQKGVYVSPSEQIASITSHLTWLETTPWIFRYAWFKPIGAYNATSGPNYGLIYQDGSNLDPWVLTEQGKVYVDFSTFDTSVWYAVGETVAASNYVDCNVVEMGATGDENCPTSIEINRFNGGASATWQFAVEEAGDYNLTMGVAGFGEPTRFDPQVQWMLVDGEKETPLGEIFKPTLPNDDSTYAGYTSTVTLPAGNLQLKLVDKAPYQPSGIKISTLCLEKKGADTPDAGVGAIDAASGNNGMIYNMQGLSVGTDFDALPAGLYIVGGKKVVKIKN